MTAEARREAIRRLIESQTQKETVDKKTARNVLISEGIYTKTGALAPEFGGRKKATA